MSKYAKRWGTIFAAVAVGFGFTLLQAQEVNLDKATQCGTLMCYPAFDDPNTYYYLPDNPRIAVKGGKPQFSFLKYARISESGEAGTGRAAGGGIIHFLVTYGNDDREVYGALQALQEKNPEAKLAGPVIYRKGYFALVTSFTEANEEFTKTVAVGKAPLMEGQKAAVSMALTREGAELLWESFKSDTPDISLVFDMEFSGIREPYEATIEGNWKRIASSHRVSVGFKYAWFGADVDMLFQELRQNGAIKITTKGESASMDQIVQSANAQLLKVMFEPATADELTRAAAEKGYDNLDRATKMLKEDAERNKAASAVKAAKKKAAWEASRDAALAAALPGKSRLIDRLLPPLHADEAAPADTKALRQTMEMHYKKGHDLYEKNIQESSGHWVKALEIAKQLHDKFVEYKAHQYLAHIAGRQGNWETSYGHWEAAKQALLETKKPMTYKKERLINIYMMWGQLLKEHEKFYEAYDVLRKGPVTMTDIKDTKYAKSHKETIGQTMRLIEIKLMRIGKEKAEKARISGYAADVTKAALEHYVQIREKLDLKVWQKEEVKAKIVLLEGKLKAAEGSIASTTAEQAPSSDTDKMAQTGDTKATGTTATDKPGASGTASTVGSAVAAAGSAAVSAASAATTAKKEEPKTAAKPAKTAAKSTTSSRAGGKPGISLVASYKLRRIKRSGSFKMSLNHYRTESQAFAMAENIGSLYRRYGNDPRVFRAVLLDDPVFKQREILVTLDGQDARTFSEHINFVAVKMRKRHQNGETTTDEVVITPSLFNAEGNRFEMSYGWKGDNNREAWLDYEMQTTWSFHGGIEIGGGWTHRDSAMAALIPPFKYRTITIEGEGDRLDAAGVRHAVITFTTLIGGKPLRKEVTIRNTGAAPSTIVDLPAAREGGTTEAVITWYLKGGGKKVSEPMTLEGGILYWDELEG
jgi:hypothetical protein